MLSSLPDIPEGMTGRFFDAEIRGRSGAEGIDLYTCSGLRGRQYVDLGEMEERLLQCPGVQAVSCFVAYRPDNTMGLMAEINH